MLIMVRGEKESGNVTHLVHFSYLKLVGFAISRFLMNSHTHTAYAINIHDNELLSDLNIFLCFFITFILLLLQLVLLLSEYFSFAAIFISLGLYSNHTEVLVTRAVALDSHYVPCIVQNQTNACVCHHKYSVYPLVNVLHTRVAVYSRK